MRGDDHDRQHHHEQRPYRPAPSEIDLLEAPVAERRHHQQRHDVAADGDGDFQFPRHFAAVQDEDRGGDDACGGWGRQAHEEPSVHRTRLHVEAGQPEGTTDDEEERPEPGRTPEVAQGERVEQEARRHAERDDVGQRVVLHPELARRSHEPGHAPVQQIHDHRHENGQRGLGVTLVERQDEREEATEEVAGGEQAGQKKDAPPALVPQLVPAALTRAPARSARHHDSTPSTVSPPRTRSPTRTRTSVSRGITQSVRDPNLIMPNRSPASSLSPRPTRHTIRRARTPAIWITVTRARSPSRYSAQRSFTIPASGSNAGTNRPGVHTRSTTRPVIGDRFTCTSSRERKMETRTAGPPHSSTSSTTSVTRPSAGDKTASAATGTRRSGSRKNPTDASVAAAKGKARRRRREANRPTASAAGTAMNGQPSRASGIFFIVTSAAA